MKAKLLILALLMSVTTMNAAKAVKPTLDCIDPACWYAGMKNPSLQLMLYGRNIATVSDVTVSNPIVRVDSVVRLDSPNYLFVYLNVKDAQPGTFTLSLKARKTNLKMPYE